MNKSRTIDFSAIKTPEQVNDIIDELYRYKSELEEASSTEKWRASVDEHVNDFLRYCEEGHNAVYMFIPLEAIAARKGSDLNGEKGHYFNLDTGLMSETIIDNDGNIICRVSADA